MITAVTQTLAEILAVGSSLISTEQIDLEHPSSSQAPGPRLNLYCYDLRQNTHLSGRDREDTSNEQDATIWFDISFLVTAWDCTVLGEQRLLSETLMLLLRYQRLPEEILPRSLRGYGELPIQVTATGLSDTAAFWRALGIPLRPALYVTVTIPFKTPKEPLIAKKELLVNCQTYYQPNQ